MHRLFLLSPASTRGRRAGLLFSDKARFELARRIRTAEGAPLGEVFSFLSGLYFRGKMAYAREYARPAAAIRVITSDRGLLSPDVPVTLKELKAMSRGDIDPAHAPYRRPLVRDARALAAELAPQGQAVLLGSIATEKYAEILLEAFGARLGFPEAFVGRGDMSRGGLMLRAARDGEELTYRELAGAVRTGKRPAKLTPIAAR